MFLNQANAFSFVPKFFLSNQCVFVGSYGFYNKANVLVVSSYAVKTLPFVIGSYALRNTTNAFSLVPMLLTLKPMLFRWFLCFSQ